MPQIVRPGVWPADAGRNALEFDVEGEDGVVPAELVREDKIVGIVPQRPGGQPGFQLLRPLSLKVLKSNRRRFDRSRFVALGELPDDLSFSLAAFLLKLLVDCDRALVEVHLFP